MYLPHFTFTLSESGQNSNAGYFPTVKTNLNTDLGDLVGVLSVLVWGRWWQGRDWSTVYLLLLNLLSHWPFIL